MAGEFDKWTLYVDEDSIDYNKIKFDYDEDKFNSIIEHERDDVWDEFWKEYCCDFLERMIVSTSKIKDKFVIEGEFYSITVDWSLIKCWFFDD